MRCDGMSETFVCTVQRFLLYKAFVHNARHVSKPINRDGTTTLMPLNAQQYYGELLNPFSLNNSDLEYIQNC